MWNPFGGLFGGNDGAPGGDEHYSNPLGEDHYFPQEHHAYLPSEPLPEPLPHTEQPLDLHSQQHGLIPEHHNAYIPSEHHELPLPENHHEQSPNVHPQQHEPIPEHHHQYLPSEHGTDHHQHPQHPDAHGKPKPRPHSAHAHHEHMEIEEEETFHGGGSSSRKKPPVKTPSGQVVKEEQAAKTAFGRFMREEKWAGKKGLAFAAATVALVAIGYGIHESLKKPQEKRKEETTWVEKTAPIPSAGRGI